jgi:hypothetical protein
MGSSSKVVQPEEVLESLKNDGTVDALRMKIIAQLKANVCFPLFHHILPLSNPLLAFSPHLLAILLSVPRSLVVRSLIASWHMEYRLVEKPPRPWLWILSSILCYC